MIDLDAYMLTPQEMLMKVASNEKERRKERKITQEKLSELSGVSLGSIRRFEQTGEISLTSLMKISIALQDTDNFTALFRKKEKTYSTIEELLNDRNRESKRHR